MHAWHIPRPRGRGPVEATIGNGDAERRRLTFRARAGAAPLKLQRVSHALRSITAHSAPARARPR